MRLNSLRHGLRTEASLIPGEDAAGFLAVSGDIRARFAPRGELQLALAERIVGLVWRLRRVSRAEAAVFMAYLREIAAERGPCGGGAVPRVALLPGIAGDDAAISGETPVSFGAAFLRDARGANALGKLARYETGLERSLYATLRELRILQSVGSSID
jgi:hypothetical protein